MQLFNPNKLPGKISLLLLLCSLLAITSMGQVTITGKVTDQGGTGIAGISIVVRNNSFGGATDASGNYSLTAKFCRSHVHVQLFSNLTHHYTG